MKLLTKLKNYRAKIKSLSKEEKKPIAIKFLIILAVMMILTLVGACGVYRGVSPILDSVMFSICVIFGIISLYALEILT